MESLNGNSSGNLFNLADDYRLLEGTADRRDYNFPVCSGVVLSWTREVGKIDYPHR